MLIVKLKRYTMITFKKIDETNYRDCFELYTPEQNTRSVDSVIWSLAEAFVNYADSRPFAIYNNEILIGYILINISDNHYVIVNMLIDYKYQSKGFGRQAVAVAINYLKNTYNATQVSIPLDLDNIKARSFWESLGFKASRNIEDGYLFMRLSI